jgi:NTP pyrophosphatase (non-canonical NTP hydrolase)
LQIQDELLGVAACPFVVWFGQVERYLKRLVFSVAVPIESELMTSVLADMEMQELCVAKLTCLCYNRNQMRTLERQNVQLDIFVDELPEWRDVEVAANYDNYYQPCSPEEHERRVAIVRSKIESGRAAEIRVSEFQDWAELDWLHPQGTFETGQKVGIKTVEEAQEYYDEITPMESRAVSHEPNRDTHPGMNEAGDYLWMLMAMASNSGVDLEEALRAKFQSDKPITLGDIHDVTKYGIGWLPLRVDNPTEVGTARSDSNDLDPFIWLRIQPIELYKYMYHLYGKEENEQKPSDAPTNLRLKAADWHADALLFLSYYVHHWTFSTLPEVAAMNFEKVSERVKQGTIDKTKANR